MPEDPYIPNGFTSEPLESQGPLVPRYHHMNKKALKWLAITAVALGVVSAGLFFFGGASFTESKVLLDIEGPTQASVGDQVTYTVKIKNDTKTDLHNVKMAFTYPENSVITDENGKIFHDDGNVSSFDIGDLAEGELKEEKIHAFLVGEKGDIKIARVKLDFNAGTVRSSFEKTAEFSTTITDVPVSVAVIAPPNAVSGQIVTYMIDYRNQTQEDISGLRLLMGYSDGFAPTKFTPPVTSGETLWDLPVLRRGAGGRITVQGRLTGREGESKEVIATLQRNIDGSYIDYQKIETTTVISSPLLSVSTSINGSGDYISHAGDTLLYTIRYQNTSNFTFSGLVLSAKLDGSMYDFSTVDPKGGFFDDSTRTLTWNSTVIPAFNALAPRATGQVTFSIKLKSVATGGGSNSLFARSTVQLMTDNVPATLDTDQIVVVSDTSTKITSQPTFRQTMFYNDASFGSSGPMPPQAGKDTAFTVHWQVVNPGSALNNAKIVGTLPQGVTWKNAVSVGAGQPEPTYNKNTSQVTWNLGTLPANVGVGGTAAYELIFQVTLRPSTTQVNLPAPVLLDPRLSGTDSLTGQSIVVTNPDLTTNSTVDRPGEGTVAP